VTPEPSAGANTAKKTPRCISMCSNIESEEGVMLRSSHTPTFPLHTYDNHPNPSWQHPISPG
jgi:hypothetical protein